MKITVTFDAQNKPVMDAAWEVLKARLPGTETAERERCAKIAAAAFGIRTGHPFDLGVIEGCKLAADAIRQSVE